MTKTQARLLLARAPQRHLKAKLNKSLTEKEAVAIVTRGVNAGADELCPMFEKRVWQVYFNARRPSYEKIEEAKAELF